MLIGYLNTHIPYSLLKLITENCSFATVFVETVCAESESDLVAANREAPRGSKEGGGCLERSKYLKQESTHLVLDELPAKGKMVGTNFLHMQTEKLESETQRHCIRERIIHALFKCYCHKSITLKRTSEF